MRYAHGEEAIAEARAPPHRVFDHLDDQARLATHMEKPSMMMMGGRMSYEFDDAKGRAVGAVIKMGGAFLGVRLFVEEVVTERDPPRRKVWETRGRPRILVIGAYRMGFEISPLARILLCVSSLSTTIRRCCLEASWANCSRLCTPAGASSAWPKTPHGVFANAP